MNTIKIIFLFSIVSLLTQGCGVKTKYTLTEKYFGDAKTLEINTFQNYADKSNGSTIHPGLANDFTSSLQNSILSLSQLNLVAKDGDLVYEGEIVKYRISPSNPTAANTAATNRLMVEINVRFFNKVKKDVDFEKRFSYFYDYNRNAMLSSVKEDAHEIIFERINQDIFNASLGNW